MTTEKSQKEEKEDENHGKNYKNWRSRRRAAIAEAHHFFAPPPPLFALKRKIVKIKKRLETSFFRPYSDTFSVFSLISNARHFVGLLCFSR